jgi:molecular chaperone GrpE
MSEPTVETKTDTPSVTDAGSAAEAQPANEAPAAPPGAGEIAALAARAAQADQNWEKYVRAVADLDNFRKRAARERQDAIRYANESLLEKLIPVVDNFEAALAAASAETASPDSLKTGVSMIGAQLRGVLRDAGLEEVDALGQPFDPALHEAVSQEESQDAAEGTVLRQLRKGYRLKDRLVRPASVVVAKKLAA